MEFSYEKDDYGMMAAILGRIVEFGDPDGGEHVENISRLTGLLLQKLAEHSGVAMDGELVAMVSAAAALHDIGKAAIPSHILNKPAPLTGEERRIVCLHPAAGAELLGGLKGYADRPFIRCARDICRWHHERWDGGGYPDGLRGDEIPPAAQIVSVADVYDALTSRRCYKSALPHCQALEMILSGQCGVFNPLLMDCLTQLDGPLSQECISRPAAAQVRAAYS